MSATSGRPKPATILGGVAFLGVLAVLTVLVMVNPILLMLLLPQGECDDKIMGKSVSPDGLSTATVSLINCGATTAFVSEVSLRTEGRGDGDRVFVVKGDKVDVEWTSNRDLSISYDRSDLIYRQAIVWDTMRISYKERQ
jgi:hypothetical protein